MNRRDFLISSLTAFLLAFFPWLRTERGLALAQRTAEAWAPFWVDGVPFMSWSEAFAVAASKRGPEMVTIDTCSPEAYIPAGTWDMTGIQVFAHHDAIITCDDSGVTLHVDPNDPARKLT